MKLSKLSMAVSFALVASAGLVGCHDDKDAAQVTYTEFTAIDGYLQNAVCCVDVNGDKSCDNEASITRSDLDGMCTVDASLVGPLLVLTDADTTDSDVKGVQSDVSAPIGLFLTAPQGSTTATPFTTLAQVQAELTGLSFEEVAADIVATLGLPEGTDFTTYDYVAESATDDTALRASVIASIVSESIAANIAALETAGVATEDSALQLSTAINLIVNPDNAAGVQGAGGESIFEVIANAVLTAEDPTDEDAFNYTEIVTNNEEVTSVDEVDTENLQDVADETDEQIDEPAPPSGASGGTGG